jgi:type I restriction enzyme, S subunit
VTDTELELPQGWMETTVNEITRIIDYRGRTPPYVEKGIPHLRSGNIKNGKIIWEKLRYVTEETYEKYMTRGLPKKGDVLFTTEAPLGEATLVPDEKFCLAQRLIIIHPLGKINSKFLLFQIISPDFQARLTGRGTGTTVTGVSSRNFKPMKIIMCPLNEQKRIVSNIEELFSKIDSAKQSLEYAKLQLEQYRASLLKSAFEGKLTEKWRKQNKDSIKQISNIDQLPYGWINTTVNELSTKEKTAIRMGPFGSSLKKHELVNSGIRVLWIENIVNNKFEYKTGKFITKEKFQQLSGFRVKPNDILVTMMGTIGRTCLVPNDIDTAIISSHLLKISVESSLCNSKFLTLTLRGNPHVLKQIERKASGVVMKGLNTKIIKNIELFLPSLKEQEQIVLQIEQGFSLIENTTQIIESSLQKLQTMKMSVLKQAFEGKLVPQDPNDEPASVLLEKIKAEKS